MQREVDVITSSYAFTCVTHLRESSQNQVAPRYIEGLFSIRRGIIQYQDMLTRLVQIR